MEELTELMVDPELPGRGHRPRAARALLAGRPDAATSGRLVVATGAPADLTLYPDFGVMPVAGHWHMRVRTERYLERRAHADRRARARTRTCSSPRARGRGVEAARAARDRPRAPGAARVLRARPHLPRHDVPGGRRDRALLGLLAGRDRAGGGRRARGSRPGRARGARPRRQDAGAGRAQPVLHDDRLVAAAAAARARLPRLLAELDHVLGAAAGPRPVRADAAHRTLL